MMLTMIAATLLAGAQPAPALDPDAMCMMALTATVETARQHPDALSKDLQSTIPKFENAFYYYIGAIVARYSEGQRAAPLKAASAAFGALPRDARGKLSADCVIGMATSMKALSNEMTGGN